MNRTRGQDDLELLRQLFPGQSDAWLKEAAEHLADYVKVLARIADREVDEALENRAE